MAQIILIGVTVWFCLSVPVAMLIGRSIALADPDSEASRLRAKRLAEKAARQARHQSKPSTASVDVEAPVARR